MTRRDPAVDQPRELYPDMEQHVEDRSDVVIQVPGEPPRQVVGDNVDENGVAHFLRISEDGEHCGGCGKDWPCEHRVGLQVVEMPPSVPDPHLVSVVEEILARRQA